VLAGLPFDQTTPPGVWSFQPKPGVKLGWQIYSWIVVGAFICGAIYWFVRFLTNSQ
jgi:hypothetical protein